MPYRICMWLPAAVQHLADNFVTPEEFEQVLADPDKTVPSRSGGLPAAIGYTETGRFLFCIYREIDETYVEPVTAYEIEE